MSYLSQFAADDDADLVLVMMMVMVVTGDDNHEDDYYENHVDDPNMISHCGTLLNLRTQKSQDWWKFMLSKGLLGTQQMENKAKAEGCHEESIDT